MPSYRPSCKVRLLLRFDDYKSTSTVPVPSVGTGPEAFAASEFHKLVSDFIPLQCTVTKNSYREADQCSITFPFRRLPVDPRILRAAHVQIFMGSIDSGDYAESVGPIGGSGELIVIPDIQPPGHEDAGLSNEVFRGYVDRWRLDLRGSDTITVDCRDLTALLIDKKFPTTGLAGIPGDAPIDQVIRLILLGEPLAPTLSAPPLLPMPKQNKVTLFGKASRTKSSLSSVRSKLTKAIARAASDPTNALKSAEVIRLQGEVSLLSTELAKDAASVAAANVSKTIVRRFGVPGLRGMRVVNATGNPLPSIRDVKGVKWLDSLGNIKRGRSAGSKEEITLWDFITDLCVASGYIVYLHTPQMSLDGTLQPTDLVISEPRIYYADRPGPIRELVYGRNVMEVQVERQYLGTNAPTAVAVNGITDRSRKTITVRYPPAPKLVKIKGKRVNRSAAPGPEAGDVEEAITLTYGTIPEDHAEEILNRVARSSYEQLSRGEFRIVARTRQLGLFPDKENCHDAVRAIPGESIRFSVSPTQEIEGLTTPMGAFESMDIATKANALISLGMAPVAATQAATASDSPYRQDVFRIRSVGLDFQASNGIQVEIEAINYLDVREQSDI